MNEIVKTVVAVTHTHTHTHLYLYRQENSGLKYTLVFNLIKHLYKHKAIFLYAFL